MIRLLDYDYEVDGQALLSPDKDVEISKADLDSADSGRDEAGFLHRIVVREKVCTWGFSYAVLDSTDYAYIMDLFAGKPTFAFSYKEGGAVKTCTAYCAKTSIVLHNKSTGIYKNLKFNIIEC